jgi:hypothetical protein
MCKNGMGVGVPVLPFGCKFGTGQQKVIPVKAFDLPIPQTCISNVMYILSENS